MALALEPDQRGSWLEGLCGGDAELRPLVADLLAHAATLDGQGFLGTLPKIQGIELTPEPGGAGQQPGTVVGPYRLERELGRGGMGTVWLAERVDGTLRRKVALKLPHQGLSGPLLAQRLARERDILAVLEHPNIARLYDAGVTERGQPFLALEYVEGVPIDLYCTEHALGLQARLELFGQVCRAVAYAHAHLVLHRDLKPLNILVTADGQVRLLDFGVAKLVQEDAAPSPETDLTELGGRALTPEYASPEQISGQPLTTASDVYSLGVVLYELLTGQRPYQLKRTTLGALEEAILTTDPARPSRIASGEMRRALAGDLDTIVLKALEKTPGARYPTVNALLDDVERSRSGQPVLARPASRAYRISKFLRRHRVGAGIATGLVLLLMAFAAAMGVQARRTALERDRANHERDRANAEREASDKVSAFLANMLSGVEPKALGEALWHDLHQSVGDARRATGASPNAVTGTLVSLDHELKGVNPTQVALHVLDQQILEPAGKTIERDMGAEPRIAGALEETLGSSYSNFGLYTQAEQHAKRAIELRVRVFGRYSLETVHSMQALAFLYRNEGRLSEAEKAYREMLEAGRRALGSDHKLTINAMEGLASIYLDQGRYADSEALYRDVLERRGRVFGASHKNTLATKLGLANLLYQLGQYDESIRLQEELLETWQRTLGPRHRDTLSATLNLASAYADVGRYDEAEKLYVEALEGWRVVSGPEHLNTLMAMVDLSTVYVQQERYREAEQMNRAALGVMRRVLGSDHPLTLEAMSDLTVLCVEQGRYREAERLGHEALEGRRKALGPSSVDTLWSTWAMADVYSGEGRYAESEKLAQEAVAGYERAKALRSEGASAARAAHGRALAGLRRYPEAEEELLNAEQHLPAKGVFRKKCVEALVSMYEEWERSDPGSGHGAQAAKWEEVGRGLKSSPAVLGH
jgi:tetratricopeptide (TPR) repeat protein